jgi:dTDP-4-dehydrorhamnose 3,5-epimerase
MKIIGTEINDLSILEPEVFGDERGYFFESYNKMKLESLTGNEYNFVQDNESRSSYGVIRGLHYQLAPFSQAKLVAHGFSVLSVSETAVFAYKCDEYYNPGLKQELSIRKG